MNRDIPSWLNKFIRAWDFYWSNLRFSILLSFLALSILVLSLYTNWPIENEKLGDYLFSLGYSLLFLAIFSIFYEVQTRESFSKMLAEINPNIESGVTVHPSHQKVISRQDAIRIYLQRKDIVRIRTSTADNYVRSDEPAYEELNRKILDMSCTLKILLYLPILQDETSLAGKIGESPITIINRQVALLDSYKEIINKFNKRISIKFFFSPLHVNFIMLGNNRMFSSLIPSINGSGTSKPCFEIFPTGSHSLFFKFQEEFDSVFCDRRLSLDFKEVVPLLERYGSNIAPLKLEIQELTLHDTI